MQPMRRRSQENPGQTIAVSMELPKVELMGLAEFLIWWIFGAWGFTYWVTTEWSLEWVDVPLMLFAGLLGPFAWWIGFCIHGGHTR